MNVGQSSARPGETETDNSNRSDADANEAAATHLWSIGTVSMMRRLT
jgi:hypothetical protein